MAELATIARPYAEALFQVASQSNLNEWTTLVDELAVVLGHQDIQTLAEHPKVSPAQTFEVIASVIKSPLNEQARNFLGVLIENGRLKAFPEIAHQFHILKSERSGVAEATVYSAFPLADVQLAEVVAAFEKRFGKRLTATVEVDPELIGGVRVVVGDEVLDTSVKARLERMKTALVA